MAKLPVYNKEGKTAGDMDVNDSVFAVPVNMTLVHQVYLAIEANARQPWAHTKDRGEVRGGGRKPWKQKGTGRARHGSIRSPIWKGGGVTFGPRTDRNYTQKVNKKVNKQAVRMCLSGKAEGNELFVVEELQKDGKTKTFQSLRQVLPGAGKSTLVLIGEQDQSVFLATRNVPEVNLQRAQDVNVADLLHHQYVIATKEAVDALQTRLA